MEIKTTMKCFFENVKQYHLAPDTTIRVIIDDLDKEPKISTVRNKLPVITQEGQRRLLNQIPHHYQPEESEELIRIIEESHMNTENLNLE